MTGKKLESPAARRVSRPLLRRWLRRGCRPAVGWSRCRRGVAAVEFALVAPILGFILLASIDLGLAVSERMAIDHVLRAGAQSAIPDPGEATVVDVMRTTAQTNFALSGTATETGDSVLALSAARYCACPESVGFAVACSTVCSGSKPTFIYYRMTATKTFTGWITPQIAFDRAAQVQIR